MTADGSIQSVRVNKLALLLLTWLGVIVGLAPVALFLGRPRLLLYIAGASALSAVFYGLLLQESAETSATSSPSAVEFLLGGLSAVYLPAAGGIVSLVVYWVVYGAAWLVGVLIGWFRLEAQVVPQSIAYYPTVVLAVLFGVGSGVGVGQLRRQLYPDIAGVKSAFYDLISRGRRRLWTTAAALVSGVALALLLVRETTGTWPYILLQVHLCILSLPLSIAGGVPSRTTSAIRAIEKLLTAAGYHTVLAPRTGDAAIDPLLANVDLIAHDDERAFVVQVKTRELSPSRVDWTAASSLQTAAWTLGGVSQKLDLTSKKVEPLMVLVGVKPDESQSLRAFSKEESVGVVDISSEDLAQILRADDPEDLRELAQRHLGLPNGQHSSVADTTVTGVSGGQS